MTTSQMTLTHNGTTYDAVPGRINRTYLGFHEHHMRMVAELGIAFETSYINTGDYALDQRGPGTEPAVGTAFGMEYVMNILRAAGSDTWEGLNGCRIMVLFEAGSDPWGRHAVGLARQDGSKHTFIFQDLADSWKAREN